MITWESIKNSLSAKRPGRTLLVAQIFSPKPKNLRDLLGRILFGAFYFGMAWLGTVWTMHMLSMS